MADGVIAHGPQAYRVVTDRLGGETRLEGCSVKFLQRETETTTGRIIIPRHVSHHAGFDLQLDVVAINHFLVLDPLVGVGNALNVGRRNDIGRQHITAHGNHGRREEVRQRQAMEADAVRQHGNDLAAVGKTRGEENHCDEGKQRAELAEYEGQEVHEVLEHGRLERCSEHSVQFLVDIEDDDNGKQQQDGKEEGTQEILDDIAVEALHVIPRVALAGSFLGSRL